MYKFTHFLFLCLASLLTLPMMAVDYVTPQAGKVYRIWNTNYTTDVIYEYSNNTLMAKTAGTTVANSKDDVVGNDFSDLFLFEAKPGVENGFMLRNIATGRYVGTVTQNETLYPTGNSPQTFVIVKNTNRSDISGDCFNIFHQGSTEWGMHEASGKRIVRWNPTTSAKSNHPSEWRFENVEFTQEMQDTLAKHPVVVAGAYYIVNDQRHKGTDWYATESSYKLIISKTTPNESTGKGIFLLRPQNGDKYFVQSLATGRYVQGVDANETAYPTATTGFSFEIKQQPKDASHTYFNIFNDYDKDWCWHANSSNKIVRWHQWAHDGKTELSPSEWKLVKDTLLTDSMIKSMIAAKTGAAVPEEGKYYRVSCTAYNRVMYADISSDRIGTETESSSRYVEIWKVVKTNAAGRYTLQNVVTGKYITNNPIASKYYTTTSTLPTKGFTFTPNTSDPYSTVYELVDNGNLGVHCGANQNYDVVCWYTGNEPNIWMFKEAKVDSATLKKQQDAYNAKKDLVVNASKYATAIAKYYDDNACTQLKVAYKAMADSTLTATMKADGIPSTFIAMTLKLKNNSWKSYKSGTNWEKRFRVAYYDPYSDYRVWNDRMGTSYQMGSYFQPTGISVRRDSVLCVFVDDIPTDATMEVELIPLGSKNGDIYSLNKGLNVIIAGDDRNVFMRYIVDTHTDSKGHKLADFPKKLVHIEGGFINGYFDNVAGMTNNDYKNMVGDGLLTANAFDIRSKSVAIHAASADIKAGCKKYDIKEMTDVWEFVVSHEFKLMGFRDKYADRCNCVLDATAVNSGLYASTGGTYYGYGAWPGELACYEVLDRAGGKLWAPGHEFGHNMQRLINTTGMTEISNNLFSNQINFEYGKTTSRAGNKESKISTLAENHVAKKIWVDYGTWGCTQMYFKLYLYFNAAKNDTTFFPRFFQLMYDEPFTKRTKAQGVTYGETDYLKFAVNVCKAANMDLSDFFEWYGFFTPINNREIGDYANYVLTTTQAMIDKAKAEMKKYPKAGAARNLIFIDDHIRQSPATYKGAPAGTMRSDYNDDVAIGTMGDYGQWEDFEKDNQGDPDAVISNATYDETTGSYTFTIANANEHVVGFKVYTATDSLVYIANEKTFTVPASVVRSCGGTPVIKAAGSNGVDKVLSYASNPTSIESVTGNNPEARVDVFALNGAKVAANVRIADAVNTLPKGVYVINGKKFIINR